MCIRDRAWVNAGWAAPAMMVMGARLAIERAGSAERSAIKDALYDTDYDAITGHITFNGIGDAQKNLLVFEVSGGKFVELTDMAILPWDEFVASL